MSTWIKKEYVVSVWKLIHKCGCDLMDPMIEKYVNRGWVLLPIYSPNYVPKGQSKAIPGKTPSLKAWSSNQGKWKFSTIEQCRKWFHNTDKNVGLQCGMYSKVTVLDFDSFLYKDKLFKGLKINTLQDYRTEGRGHFYFQYDPLMESKNLRLMSKMMGVEVKNDGTQVVIPPSIHPSGDVYKWVDLDAPLQKMPPKLKSRIRKLFDDADHLKKIMEKCRAWVMLVFKEKMDVHNEELMLAIASELKANSGEERDIQMFCKIMLGEHYDKRKTTSKWNYIDPTKIAKSETLKRILPRHMHNGIKSKPHAVQKNQVQVRPQIKGHAELNEKDFYITKNGNVIEFRYKKYSRVHKQHAIYKRLIILRLNEKDMYLDKNYAGSGEEKIVNENNSGFVAFFIKTAQSKGVRITQWIDTGRGCKTAKFLRIINAVGSDDWIYEYYWRCKLKRGNKWVLYGEYIPIGIKDMNKSEKYAEVRRLRIENKIPIKALSNFFGISVRRIQQIVPKDMILSCEMTH